MEWLIELIQQWLSGAILYHPTAEHLAQALALLATITGAVQAIKKSLETAAGWEWLLKLFPALAKVFDFFAHGIGPLILNGVLTLTTMLSVALSTDGVLTWAEALAAIIAAVGADVLYRLIRGWLFPKTA